MNPLIKKATNPFELHVALLMVYEGMGETAARLAAWSEGAKKLSERVNKTHNAQIITMAENMGV